MDRVGVGEVGVLGQLREQFAQLGELGAGQRQVGLRITLQLEVGAGVARTVDQFEAQLALGDMARLAQPRMVEPCEVGVLGVVAEQQHLIAAGLGQQDVGEGIEGGAGDHRVTPRRTRRRRGTRTPARHGRRTPPGSARPCRS